ncbi:MAG TPA: folate-binding protein [Solirubrobacteraceae bacterium]|nr:folate-binding protein [Solirubrobacteraceae bacterium]
MACTDVLLHEYTALREAAGLVDRSERGKLALTGPGAKEFLHGQVSQDILALTPGHGAYAALLTNKGKMRADLRVLDTGQELHLDTERAALQELFNALRSFAIGYDVQLHKRTLQSGLLSLIGPDSDTILSVLGVTPQQRAPTGQEHAHALARPAGVLTRMIRTDIGVDLLCDSESLPALSSALIDAGARPVGEPAAECLRIESGRPRYGIDLNDGVIPQEAGLNERAVSFTKGCYVGQETVARLYYRGKPNRELRGVRAEAPLLPGTTLLWEGREVATLTSAAVSPRLGPVGLALVRREVPLDTPLDTSAGVSARVLALPFS